MLYLFFLVSLITLTSALPAKQVQQYQCNTNEIVHNFVTSYVNHLTPNDLQLFANFLYHSYLFAQASHLVKHAANDFLKEAWNTHQYVKYCNDTIPLQDDFTNIFINFQKGLTLRKSIEETQERYSTILEKNISPAFLETMESYISLITEKQENEAKQTQDMFEFDLQRCSTRFEEVSKSLQNIGKDLLSIANVQKNSESSYRAQRYDFLCVEPNLEDACNVLMNTINSINEHAIPMEQVALNTAQEIYLATYEVLTKLPDIYQTILFNAQGLIPIKERNEKLPAFLESFEI